MTIDWLPELVTLEEYKGDWGYYLEVLYSFFKDDFVNKVPRFNELGVGIKHELLKGKEITFWHIVSEGDVEVDRIPSLRRCERIRWPRPIIEHNNDQEIKIWEIKKNRSKRVYLWFEEYDYLVVLVKRPSYYLLLTAFPIEQEHYRRKLHKEFNEFKKTEAASG